jgi:hypothetical protein
VNQDCVGHANLAFPDGVDMRRRWRCQPAPFYAILLRHSISLLKAFHTTQSEQLIRGKRRLRAISLLRAGKSNKMYPIATYFALQTSILS